MPKPLPDTPMSAEDFARLDSLERRIAVAWDEAALALAEIKFGKLYRTTRDGKKQTWDQYCHLVHRWTPQWANKLIKRAKTLQRLKAKSGTEVSISPTAVGHLDGLNTQEQAEVVGEAGPAPKAKDVAEAKHKKLMDRFKPGGDMHQPKQGGKKKPFAGYLVTVVTPDKGNLSACSEYLPSPITDFNAHSVSGWVLPAQLGNTLTSLCVVVTTLNKVKVTVERD